MLDYGLSLSTTSQEKSEICLNIVSVSYENQYVDVVDKVLKKNINISELLKRDNHTRERCEILKLLLESPHVTLINPWHVLVSSGELSLIQYALDHLQGAHPGLLREALFWMKKDIATFVLGGKNLSRNPHFRGWTFSSLFENLATDMIEFALGDLGITFSSMEYRRALAWACDRDGVLTLLLNNEKILAQIPQSFIKQEIIPCLSIKGKREMIDLVSKFIQ